MRMQRKNITFINLLEWVVMLFVIIGILVAGCTATYLDNKKYSLPHGTAHFLEHYLIEHSIYGNILEIFSNTS